MATDKKDNNFLLEILSPVGIILKEYVEEVTLPTAQGEITILPHHASLFTKLDSGEIAIRQNGKVSFIAITGGFLELQNDNANVLADYAIRSEKIEAKKAEDAKKNAEKILAAKDKLQEMDFRLAEKELQRSILKLKVYERLQQRHRASE